ncbi:MAG TPA: hypothetical protein VEO53_15510, partial [Candidatus Binatia bacterium]|nr:hypothetical protein [Candidatus Binatia bacterium]
MNLTSPSNWLDADRAWPVLCHGLFASLRQCVAAGTSDVIAQASRDLESWRSYFESGKQDGEIRRRQWLTARLLVWCAEQAAQPTPLRNQMDYATFALAGLPEEFRGHEAWAFEAIRLLVPVTRDRVRLRPGRRTVALNDRGRSTAHLATLVVDLLEPGAGHVFQHPEFTLHTLADDEFRVSLQRAFSAACSLSAGAGQPPWCDLRWRLVGLDGGDIPHVEGPSASGEAALGACLAWRGQSPDEPLIVLAQCAEDGRLNGVGGISEKVKAVAACGRFDTIVVATEADKALAEANLPPNVGLRVLVTGALTELTEQRSVLAEELERYCARLIERLDRTPWFHQGRNIAVGAVAVPMRVLKESTRFEPELDKRRSGGDLTEDRLREPAREHVDPELAALYEEATREKR